MARPPTERVGCKASIVTLVVLVSFLPAHGDTETDQSWDGGDSFASLSEELVRAILAGDFAKLQRTLAAAEDTKALANSRHKDGSVPLMTAGVRGEETMVRALLEAGADPNSKSSSDGQTALMRAAMYQRSHVVNQLLRKHWRSDPNIVDKQGMTALMHAAISTLGKKNDMTGANIIGQLMRAGADAGIQQQSTGFTALIFAVLGGSSVEEIRAIIGSETLDKASRRRLLLQHDRERRTALMWALEAQRSDIKDYLIEQGADEGLVISDHSKPLTSADMKKLGEARCDHLLYGLVNIIH